MNIAADGSRVSAARAFLRPNLERKNLTLLVETNVTKILFRTATRPSASPWSAPTRSSGPAKARREVILCAGTIHGAKLLMLSGASGMPDDLRKLGIAPVANLRGVGQNLQDHVLVSGLVYKYKGKMPDRPADSDAVEAEVYLSSGVSSHDTDINLVLEQLPIATPEAAARFGAPPSEGFTIAPALVQPSSRGRVRLTSANWRDAPVIEANHLGTDQDLAAIVKAIEAARELGNQKALDGMREAEVVPGPSAKTRKDLEDLARTAAASFGHAVGTAKMGVDADAVVDPHLRVRGLLRHSRRRRIRHADDHVRSNQRAGDRDRWSRGRDDHQRTLSRCHSRSMCITTSSRTSSGARRTDAHSPVGGIAPATWSKGDTLAFMDEAEIDVAVTSISTPGVHMGDNAKARALARRCNELSAELVQGRPDRFGGFACLPLPDLVGSLAELTYALDVLKLDGVVLFSNARGIYLGDDRFEPLFQELERRRAVVFVHPTASPDVTAHTLGLPDSLIDTSPTRRAPSQSSALQRDVRPHAERVVHLLACGRNHSLPRDAVRHRLVDEMGVIPDSA